MVKLQAAARIISSSDAPHPPLSSQVPGRPETDLFSDEELFGVQKGEYLRKTRNRILFDMEEAMGQNRWDDILALYHPVEEKLPELVRAGADIPVRQKLAFALGQTGQFDEAIQELQVCAGAEPDNFLTRSSLAYTAYNSLYAAKNKKIFLAGKARADRIALAHDNFKKAQKLRPGGVTNFYREGMLFTQIENKPGPGLEKFETACVNWEGLSEKEKADRHQEKKNYIKSLYRSASLLLAEGNGGRAMERITRCLEQDEQSGHISLGFKYFALGKVHFCLERFDEARSALLFALQSSHKGAPVDFIHELLARTCLALGKTDKALEAVEGVPEKLRRSYYRWTEADALCAAGRFEPAKKVLSHCADRDSRSRHISLIRLAKIEYKLHNYEPAMEHAGRACEFFTATFGNPYFEGLFWQSLCAFKAGRVQTAQSLFQELSSQCRYFPRLDRLRELIHS